MSESQSRYSIVERLTRTKLDIMTAMSNLNEDIIRKEQKIASLKKDLDNHKKDAELELERDIRKYQREIEKAEIDYKNAVDLKSQKESVYKDKLEAIEKALKSIEEISKTSPTINK